MNANHLLEAGNVALLILFLIGLVYIATPLIAVYRLGQIKRSIETATATLNAAATKLIQATAKR